MNVALWLAQVALSMMFLMAGGMKLMTPHDALAAQMGWVAASPAWLPPVIGVFEVAGALGLVLPAALRVLPFLTPTAAGGIATVLVLATGMHVVRAEWGMAAMTMMLLVPAVFVAYGRARLSPVVAR